MLGLMSAIAWRNARVGVCLGLQPWQVKDMDRGVHLWSAVHREPGVALQLTLPVEERYGRRVRRSRRRLSYQNG